MSLMTLRERSRLPSAAELDGILWLGTLSASHRRLAAGAMRVVQAEPGEVLCRTGRPAVYWFGVVDGLLKMSSDAGDGGAPLTFTGVPPGGL